MRHLALVVLLVACGKDEAKQDKARPEEAKVDPKPAPPSAEPPKPEAEPDDDICKAFDRTAVAGAIGVGGLAKISGTRAKAAEKHRTCGYAESADMTNGHGLGVTFSTAAELEQRDPVGRFTWEPFDGLGTPGAIGREAHDVHVQGIAKGILIKLRLSHGAKEPAALEPLAVAAWKKVVETLPAEPAKLLE